MMSTNHYRIGLIVALAAALCGPSLAIAQQGERHYEHAYSRFDVDFPGGTLSEYVEALRKARPDGAVNIVVMPTAKGLPVPPVRLVAVTVEAAIQILEGPYTTDDGLSAEVEVRTYRIGDSPDMVMKILAQTETWRIRSAVWSVEAALAYGQTAEKLLEAVEAARSLFPTKAEISYHPPTGLLIARGTDEQLDLVRDVLEQLIDGAERRNEEMDSIRRDIDELEADRFRVTMEMRVAEKELYVARVVLERLVKINEMPEEIAHAELDVTRAAAERMIREQEGERLSGRIARSREALKRYETVRE